jgi:hypothetical protein
MCVKREADIRISVKTEGNSIRRYCDRNGNDFAVPAGEP